MDIDLALYVEHQIFFDYLFTTHALEDHDFLSPMMACDSHNANHSTTDQSSYFIIAYLGFQGSLLLLLLLCLLLLLLGTAPFLFQHIIRVLAPTACGFVISVDLLVSGCIQRGFCSASLKLQLYEAFGLVLNRSLGPLQTTKRFFCLRSVAG